MALVPLLERILRREGWPDYTEPSDTYPDRGGPTKGGITLTALRRWRKEPRISQRDLRALTKDEALAILRQRYVGSNGIHLLEETPLFEQVVDNSVLSGPYLSVCDLQLALGVYVDGVIGPKTCAAVAAQGAAVRGKLVRTRAMRIVAFVQQHPKQLVYLKGWMRRILSFIDGDDHE